MTLERKSAVANPSSGTPPRRVGSVRLTSHVDIEQLDAGLRLRGGARVLRSADGTFDVVGAATVEARIGADRVLEDLDVSPPHEVDLTSLLGRVVGRGFRAALDIAFGDHGTDALHLLLDDLPAAALISGYAALYSGAVRVGPKHLSSGVLRPDICSGWRSDGTMLTSLRDDGGLPIPLGPPRTDLGRPGDPAAWHQLDPITPGAMRRQRLLDVGSDRGDTLLDVSAMFRDSHRSRHGDESILHEYTLTARLDPTTQTISGCEAQPRVLPWPECPAAGASARRVDGQRLVDLSTFVVHELRGTSTCTHLNDLLRSLSKLQALLPHLVPLGLRADKATPGERPARDERPATNTLGF